MKPIIISRVDVIGRLYVLPENNMYREFFMDIPWSVEEYIKIIQ